MQILWTSVHILTHALNNFYRPHGRQLEFVTCRTWVVCIVIWRVYFLMFCWEFFSPLDLLIKNYIEENFSKKGATRKFSFEKKFWNLRSESLKNVWEGVHCLVKLQLVVLRHRHISKIMATYLTAYYFYNYNFSGELFSRNCFGGCLFFHCVFLY